MEEHQMQNGQGTSENSSVQVDSVASSGGGGDRVLGQEKNNGLGINRKDNIVESQKDVCVIDVKCNHDDEGDDKVFKCDNLDSEKVCRICYLSSDQLSETKLDLIQLGCGCKEELGIAHQHCAEAWFKLKGDRCCEICGQTAKNVTGVGDERFMEEWNERRLNDTNIIPSSERRPGFWHGQTLCNLIMACLVVAFVLPWFFRVNTL